MELCLALANNDVLGVDPLPDGVVPGALEDHPPHLAVLGSGGLSAVKARRVGHGGLDDERASFPKAPGDVGEATNLLLLREQTKKVLKTP